MKDAHTKLSKRNGDASYQDLVAKGYLSEAILNYLLLLGWSPKGEMCIRDRGTIYNVSAELRGEGFTTTEGNQFVGNVASLSLIHI